MINQLCCLSSINTIMDLNYSRIAGPETLLKETHDELDSTLPNPLSSRTSIRIKVECNEKKPQRLKCDKSRKENIFPHFQGFPSYQRNRFRLSAFQHIFPFSRSACFHFVQTTRAPDIERTFFVRSSPQSIITAEKFSGFSRRLFLSWWMCDVSLVCVSFSKISFVLVNLKIADALQSCAWENGEKVFGVENREEV